MNSRKLWLWFGLAAIVIVLDQLSKQAIALNFEYGERLNLLPVFDLTLVYNYGAAWSFLSDAGGWQRWLFTAISFVFSIVIIVWISRLVKESSAKGGPQVLLLLALSLILGGAIGNLIDRVLYGYVIDFLLVYYQDHFFPVFNIADSAISVGAGLMLIDVFKGETSDLSSDKPTDKKVSS